MKTAWIAFLILLVGCKGSVAKDIKTGATIGSLACNWVEETTDAGAILAVCATLDEIAKWGRKPGKILKARGEPVPKGFDHD